MSLDIKIIILTRLPWGCYGRPNQLPKARSSPDEGPLSAAFVAFFFLTALRKRGLEVEVLWKAISKSTIKT